MKPTSSLVPYRWRLGPIAAAAAVALALASGCATAPLQDSVTRANQTAERFTQGQLAWVQCPEQRAVAEQLATQLLQKPLTQNDAVRLGLVNSPALQAVLAQHWADATRAAQSGRITNPVFSFERVRLADELELGRLLSVGLLDVLTLPQRQALAQHQIEEAQLRLTQQVIAYVTQVRQAWVNAVAAQQTLGYTRQVVEIAETSAELANRMQAAGNFTKLDRARQQAFYADASNSWAAAQHAHTAAREQLVRALGLSQEQAKRMALPDRLPDLPTAPLQPQEASQRFAQGNLEIQLAKAGVQSSATAQGLHRITDWTDIEVSVRHDRITDTSTGDKATKRGYEVQIRLPVWDWGELQRTADHAQTLAALQRLEASVRATGSQLRESYSAYRTAYDVSKHFRDEIVPLRKTISEENLLRYNGMLIGVFALLGDAKDQVSSVMAAIHAQQQFWLADAALQATIAGQPTGASVSVSAVGASKDAGH